MDLVTTPPGEVASDDGDARAEMTAIIVEADEKRTRPVGDIVALGGRQCVSTGSVTNP